MKSICNQCGSDNVVSIKTYKKTLGPKNPKRHPLMPQPKVTYGYKFIKHTCVCGNVWEERCQ